MPKVTKKSTVAKPTAAELGVGSVVGRRGKVRSENPNPLVPPITLDAAVEALKDWAEWSGSEGKRTADARKYMARRMRVGFAPIGATVVNTANGDEYEVLEHFPGSSTKVRTEEGKTITVAPATEVERLPADEKPRRTRKTEESTNGTGTPVSAKPASSGGEKNGKPHVGKPREGGWNGYSGSALGRWMGSKGWTKEEAAKALAALGLNGVAEKSIPTLLKAGKDGSRPVPTLSAEHEREVTVAAGKAEPETKTVVKPITKKALKRAGK